MPRIPVLGKSETLKADAKFCCDQASDSNGIRINGIGAPTDDRRTTTRGTFHKGRPNPSGIVGPDGIMSLTKLRRVSCPERIDVPDDEGAMTKRGSSAHRPRDRRIINLDISRGGIQHAKDIRRKRLVPRSPE